MIISKSKVADEDVYVVVKTPEKAPAIIDYISAKSFRLVKRRSEGTGQETIYSDYRNVDGEMVPFVFVIQGDVARNTIRVCSRPFAGCFGFCRLDDARSVNAGPVLVAKSSPMREHVPHSAVDMACLRELGHSRKSLANVT